MAKPIEKRGRVLPAPPTHRNEFPAGYSLTGCSPAEPASASPADLILQPRSRLLNQSSANGSCRIYSLSQRRAQSSIRCLHSHRHPGARSGWPDCRSPGFEWKGGRVRFSPHDRNRDLVNAGVTVIEPGGPPAMRPRREVNWFAVHFPLSDRDRFPQRRRPHPMGCHEQEVTSGQLAHIERKPANLRVIERDPGYVRKDAKSVARQAPNRELPLYIDVDSAQPSAQFRTRT